MAFSLSSFLLFLLLNLYSSTQHKVSAGLLMEEGYTVSTVLDGNKLNNGINPSSLLPRLGGTHDLLILDSPNSIFYTISFPISQDSEKNRFSGNGTAGFSDGDLGSAMFHNPRSFAVDLKGNIYVADKSNHAIRKISKSGVTTIAGGYSRKIGNVDGPAQNASFSGDFELVFVPEVCALLISDRGNRLVRQMNLKPQDCASHSSRPQLGLTGASLLGISCLVLGLVIGFAARPSIVSCVSISCFSMFIRKWVYLHLVKKLCRQEVSGARKFSKTWKHCQINLGRHMPIVYSDIRSAIANSTTYSLMDKLFRMCLSHLSIMFRIYKVENRSLHKEPFSLLDSDSTSNHETTKEQIFADQLKDLLSFDGDLNASEVMSKDFKQGNNYEMNDVSTCSHGRIDGLIQANILGFTELQLATQRHPLEGSLMGCSGLVKRK